MKRIFFVFVLILSSFIVKAQGDYNFSPLGVGFGVSSIRGYTNVAEQNNGIAYNANFSYYYSPYLPITAELQSGTLSGGSIITDPYKRQYSNNYISMTVHVDVQLGQFLDYSDGGYKQILKNFYFGPGIGFIDDNVKNQRTNLVPESGEPVGSYIFPGVDKSINEVLALRAGYEVKFYNEYDEPFIRLDIEYTHNIVFGEGLDGYDDPSSRFKNNYPDQYRQITIGMKYNFGLIQAYTKRIRNSFY